MQSHCTEPRGGNLDTCLPETELAHSPNCHDDQEMYRYGSENAAPCQGSCLVLILVLIACAGFTPILVSPRICTRGLRHSSTEGTSASWPVIVTLLAHSHTLTANPRLGETLHVTRNAFHPLFQFSRAHVRPSHRAKNERRTSDAPSVGNKNRGISLQFILPPATSPHVWRHDTPRRLVLLSRKIPSHLGADHA